MRKLIRLVLLVLLAVWAWRKLFGPSGSEERAGISYADGSAVVLELVLHQRRLPVQPVDQHLLLHREPAQLAQEDPVVLGDPLPQLRGEVESAPGVEAEHDVAERPRRGRPEPRAAPPETPST